MSIQKTSTGNPNSVKFLERWASERAVKYSYLLKWKPSECKGGIGMYPDMSESDFWTRLGEILLEKTKNSI